MENKECCPQFDPATWQGREVIWVEKAFIQDRVTTFMHIPLNMSRVILRMFAKIQKADAAPAASDFLMLARGPSPWHCDMYMNVTKPVPDAKMVKLSGTFLTKVFDGPYNRVPKWLEEMGQYVAQKGRKALKYYIYFTTCPKCMKKWGHNYVVVFAQVA